MHAVVERFGQACHAILKEDSGAAGLERIRALLERELLSNQEIIDTYLAPDNTPLRRVLYEDPEFGFCVVAHNYPGPRQGRAHDHGPAWAIYGQVIGSITMTEFEILEPPKAGAPGRVKAVKDYQLMPGHAVVYAQGVVHAPLFPSDVRVIRIEGKNLEGVPRDTFEAV